ncbi:hypothetical protein ACSBR2_006000 [Camellia fascicularis]
MGRNLLQAQKGKFDREPEESLNFFYFLFSVENSIYVELIRCLELVYSIISIIIPLPEKWAEECWGTDLKERLEYKIVLLNLNLKLKRYVVLLKLEYQKK